MLLIEISYKSFDTKLQEFPTTRIYSVLYVVVWGL